MLTPIAANTIAKLSGDSSIVPLPLSTRLACLAIYAPISLCGRPFPEKRGIFCPLAIEFMTSIAEIPV